MLQPPNLTATNKGNAKSGVGQSASNGIILRSDTPASGFKAEKRSSSFDQ